MDATITAAAPDATILAAAILTDVDASEVAAVSLVLTYRLKLTRGASRLTRLM